MNVYITYDRYEHDEWYSVYHIDTNKQKAIKHFLELDLVDFISYGPDDCHAFQLQKVIMSKKEYDKLCKLANSLHEEDELKEMLINIFDEREYEVETIFSTDGCTDVWEMLDYYCDKLGVDKNDEDAKYEVQKKLWNDDNLFEEILKEYINVYYG